MSTDKLPKDERIIAGWVRFVIALAVIAFLWLGVFNKPSGSGSDKFSNVTVWDALHPMSFVNFLGVGLFFLFLFFLSGLWRKITGDAYIEAGTSWPLTVGFGAGILAAILIFV